MRVQGTEKGGGAVNPQAARYLLLKLLADGLCPSCRRPGLTTTNTLDGGRLYTCGRCGFKLLAPAEVAAP
jgi:hypothetical protein